jgi:hypothetical protein
MPDLAWLAEARVVIYEAYWPPFYPDIEFDAARMVHSLKAVNATAVRFGTIGYWAYFQTPHYPMHPQLGERDLLREAVDACHQAGLRLIAYIPLSHPMAHAALRQRPAWAQRDLDGQRHGWYHAGDRGRPFLYRICSRGLYRPVAREITRQIVANYDVDAIYFDGPHYYTPCYCYGCQESFRERTGMPLPRIRRGREAELDWQDPAIRAYFRWVEDIDHEVLQEQIDTIRSLKDIPVLAHGSSVLHRLYKQPHQRLIQQVDGTLFEMGEDYLHRLLIACLTRSAGKIMWSYTGAYNNHPRIFGHGKEWVLEGFGSLAVGGSALVAAGGRLYYDLRGAEYVREVYDFQARHSELFTGLMLVPFLALPYSQATAQWFGRDDPETRYNTPWRAAYELLHDAKLQTNPVLEAVLDDPAALARYPAIYVPNVACLSDRQVQHLREYVAAGGGLIAAGNTSTHDAEGVPRGNFALADVLGVDFIGEDWIGHDTYLHVDSTAHPALGTLQPGELIPVQRRALVQARSGAEVLATIQRFQHDTGQPALVVNAYGQGRVVYFASAPEDAYVQWLYLTDPLGPPPIQRRRMGYDRLPCVRDLLAGAVRWVTRETLPFEMDPDPGIVALLTEKPGLRVLSLINLTGPRRETSRCVVPYTVPRRHITVRLRCERDVPVELLRTGQTLSTVRRGPYLEVVVPELHDYEAVVVRM